MQRAISFVNLMAACLATSACENDSDADAPQASGIEAKDSLIDWQTGSDDTMVADQSGMTIRCWRQFQQFDCLVFRSITRDEQREFRTYSRSILDQKPRTIVQINNLDLTDGYECEVSGRLGNRTLQELFWADGRVVDRRHSREAFGEAAWIAADIVALAHKHSVAVQRPLFACLVVDRIVQTYGRTTINSVLLTWQIMATGADRRNTMLERPLQRQNLDVRDNMMTRSPTHQKP